MDTDAAAGDQSMPQALAERTSEESREGGPGTETWDALTAQNYRRPLHTKEEVSALSPGNS